MFRFAQKIVRSRCVREWHALAVYDATEHNDWNIFTGRQGPYLFYEGCASSVSEIIVAQEELGVRIKIAV